MQTRLHTVRRLRMLTGGCFVLEVEGPLPATRAGQFYMLRTEERWPVLLPRPFSLYDRAQDGSSGGFLMKAIGPGTRAFERCRAGERVWLTGPLGNAFPELDDPLCVAGGIGLAPFLLLARQQRAARRPPLRLLFGGRDRAALAGIDDFGELARIDAATDDGSFGFAGLVSDLLADRLARGAIAPRDAVFCCGPEPMMRAIAHLCAARGMACHLSLETYMACGYGVCNGCSVPMQPHAFGGWPFSRACQQGPVYLASDLVLE
jgi:dihydroorotate dehydrogenase electron transfer subunit